MNMISIGNKKKLAQVVAFALLSGASATTLAAEYWLCTAITTKVMPDTGEVVVMWGYAQDNDNNLANGCGNAVTIPGPLLTVLPGDTALTVHLRNGLAEPVSIVVPGQLASMTPVRNADGRMRLLRTKPHRAVPPTTLGLTSNPAPLPITAARIPPCKCKWVCTAPSNTMRR